MLCHTFVCHFIPRQMNNVFSSFLPYFSLWWRGGLPFERFFFDFIGFGFLLRCRLLYGSRFIMMLAVVQIMVGSSIANINATDG